MRVLFVAPYLPTPGSGGRTRLINIMSRLAERHEVHLVAFPARDQLGMTSPYPGEVVELPSLRPRPGGVRGSIAFWRERLEPFPAFAGDLTSDAMRAAIARAVDDLRPDVVQIETTEMAQYLTAVPDGPLRVLDLQDVATRWFRRVVGEGSGKHRLHLAIEYWKTRRYDARHVRIPDLVLAASEIEASFLNGLAGVEPVVVPNGVDTEAFAPTASETDPDRIAFIGPMSYIANLEGMRWFAREIWPSIARAHPAARVDLVGEPAPDEQWPEAFDVLGRVDDVRPFLGRAACAIVPVTFGSGTRYKILEALSMERAVVSTAVGAEGLDVEHDRHLLIADDPVGFAGAVGRLMTSASDRARLGAAGRAHVVERFDWGPVVERIDQAWTMALERRASTNQE